MRIVFMGTPTFAVPTLRALAAAEGHDLVAVFTRPDAKSGRGNSLRPSPVKEAAQELDIPVFTPMSLRDESAQQQLAQLEPDALVVAAYGMILPQEVLDIPTVGAYNVHASLLPRWRGAAPVQRAVLEGDEHVGVCVMKVEAGLDTGDYHTAGKVEVGERSCEELTEAIAHIGAQGMVEALDYIEAGTYEWTVQDEEQVTYAAKIAKEEVLLEPQMSALELLRRIQASSKQAPARCEVCGKVVQIVQAHEVSDKVAGGVVVLEKKRILLGTASGAVQLDVVKPQGKREMEASSWIAGLRNAEQTWCGL